MNWLSRLFGKADNHPEAALAAAQEERLEQSADLDPQQNLLWMHAADINKLYYRWLIGQSAAPQQEETVLDKKILEALRKVADSETGGAAMVPRVPAVIPQLLRSLRDENASAKDLSQQIAHDVVLVAEVIHEANSPFYRPAKPIHSLESAVLLLGQNGLRLLIARVAFRPIINLQSGQFTKRVAPLLWTQAELCADACNLLGQQERADPFECFLSGLMQNVGMVVAFRIIDRGYTGRVLPDADEFCLQFTQAARVLSSRIAKAWEFPPNVVEVIEHFGDREHAVSQSALGKVLYVSDQVSKMRLLIDHGLLDEEEHFVRFGLSPSALHCLDVIKRRLNLAA